MKKNRNKFVLIIVIIIISLTVVISILLKNLIANSKFTDDTISSNHAQISLENDQINVYKSTQTIESSKTKENTQSNREKKSINQDLELFDNKTVSASEFTHITEQIIQSYVGNFNGDLQIYFKILDNNQTYIDQGKSMYPASLMKLFLMAEIFDEIEKEEITYEEVEHLLIAMITQSDNYSYNALLEELIQVDPNGNPFMRIKELCDQYDFVETKPYNYFQETGFDFSYLAQYLPSYAFETSVTDLGRFYELLYKGELISPKASEEMLNLLNQQQRKSKIPFLLPEEAITYNKTGELDNFSHDSCLVKSPRCDYILIVMSENYDFDGSADYLIQKMSLSIYNYLNKTNTDALATE
ncbi:MAG: serine hydrolase [Clostridiaceae bacterium]|nr:serine hydrolase [Clostridiaceae bacterium]